MTKVFSFPLTVYYEDTDCMGIVYQANYIKYFERTRTEWLFSLPLDPALWMSEGHGIVVKKIEIEYLSSARLMDRLTCEAKVERLGGSSITMRQRVLRGEEVLAEGLVVMVCVNAQKKPEKMSEILRKELEAYV